MTVSTRRFGKNFLGYLVSARYVLGALCAIFVTLWLLLWWAESGAPHGSEHLRYGPWQSLYLAAATALTIGYGDLAPVTIWGRVIAIALGIEGLILMGVVVAAAVAALPDSED